MRLFKLLLLFTFLSIQVIAQKAAPENWFNLDNKIDKTWGISTEKAYKDLNLSKNTNKIIVAVIDGGTEIDHEDLKTNLWVNPKEIAGNGLDDDKNGYVDDVYGWNFIGGKGGNVKDDTYEYTRILGAYLEKGYGVDEKPKFKTEQEKVLYEKAEVLYKQNFDEVNGQYKQFREFLDRIQAVVDKTGSKNPTEEQIEAIPASSKDDKMAKMIVKYIVKTGGMENSPIISSFKEAEEQLGTMVNINLNKKYNSRNLVGDDYNNLNERYYGNNEVNAPNTDHGTHVAGIIAANRNNDNGIKGICEQALIMTLRVVPNGDERDKDIANAIRYAADNGAKVINMSFGKKLSPNKDIVDEAVLYAQSKDVLFVHAAGNDSKDLSKNDFFPMPTLLNNNTKVSNWIEVGASGWGKGKARVAPFSNYGKEQVEVFAPGVAITSTVPESKYKSFDGTSMASPVVAGVAASIRVHYPEFTASQTKQIILMSAVPCKERVFIPGTKKKSKLKKLSVTGGIVNLYDALILAEKVKQGEVKLP